MASTPEGRSKNAVAKVIDCVRQGLATARVPADDFHVIMPVPSAFGDAGMTDFVIMHFGRTWYVETKADPLEGGKGLSPRQVRFRDIIIAQARYSPMIRHFTVFSETSFFAFRDDFVASVAHIARSVPGFSLHMQDASVVPWRTTHHLNKRKPPPVLRIKDAS